MSRTLLELNAVWPGVFLTHIDHLCAGIHLSLAYNAKDGVLETAAWANSNSSETVILHVRGLGVSA